MILPKNKREINEDFSRIGGGDDRKKLFLRNPIRLDDVPIDDLNAIVFVLEYMVAIPLGAPSKPVLNYPIYLMMIVHIELFRMNLYKIPKLPIRSVGQHGFQVKIGKWLW